MCRNIGYPAVGQGGKQVGTAVPKDSCLSPKVQRWGPSFLPKAHCQAVELSGQMHHCLKSSVRRFRKIFWRR